MQNIHASCIKYKNKGVLFLGKSGSGKSDLCLRFINLYGAKLVADDRTDLAVKKGKIYAKAPPILFGRLEVRGVGIINVPAIKEVPISLVVELVENLSLVERMPEPDFFVFEGVNVAKIRLYAFEFSAVDKIIRLLISKDLSSNINPK